MDGVLVDVSQSYRLAIKKTVEFFIGRLIDFEQIDRLKIGGGYNDDYDCTEAILKNHGKFIPREIIIKKFQEYYIGRQYKGLMNNEKWLLEKSVLTSLIKKHKLAIFTGRPANEAHNALRNSTTSRFFKAVITADDTPNKKPAPDGINMVLGSLKSNSAVYIGDSIDDLQAARAANIDFIGVLPPETDRNRLRNLFKENGVKIVLESINSIRKAIK